MDLDWIGMDERAPPINHEMRLYLHANTNLHWMTHNPRRQAWRGAHILTYGELPTLQSNFNEVKLTPNQVTLTSTRLHLRLSTCHPTFQPRLE